MDVVILVSLSLILSSPFLLSLFHSFSPTFNLVLSFLKIVLGLLMDVVILVSLISILLPSPPSFSFSISYYLSIYLFLPAVINCVSLDLILSGDIFNYVCVSFNTIRIREQYYFSYIFTGCVS